VLLPAFTVQPRRGAPAAYGRSESRTPQMPHSLFCRLVLEQGPALLLSLVIAELFYKFHSFLLETGAFLVTWFVIDFVIQTGLKMAARPK
jgi:hypothetical protein